MWQPDNVKEFTTGPGPTARFYTVVGVVGRVSIGGLIASADDARVGAYYFPYAQSPDSFVTFAIRTAGEPLSLTGSVRREISAIDPELPFYSVRTIEELMDRSVSHAGHSLATGRASASSAARMAPRAPCSRERTVPTGMPSTSAIWSCVMSR